jgi:molybdopterin/thiamine biosynthesis adenylyltransferase
MSPENNKGLSNENELNSLDEQQFLPEHNSGISLTKEEFYETFTKSSSAFIDAELQEKLRYSNILIAGSGSIGNPSAMMLTRIGAENIVVMDPDNVEVSNLPRQQYTIDQLGENKAKATLINMAKINPYVAEKSQYVPEGMTYENVETYVKQADIVIDAIDIRSLDIIYALHKHSAELKKPVLVGYDLAGTAMVAVYRYDKENIKPLKGKLQEDKIEEFTKVQKAYSNGEVSEADFLNYVYKLFTGPINPLKVPVEQLEELIERNSDDPKTYQLGTTATVLSALTAEATRRIIAGEDLKEVILVDIPSQVRRTNPTIISKIPLLLRALSAIQKRNKKVEDINKIL